MATQQRVELLHGHKRKVTGLAFTPDGRRLASSAKDGDVMVWDLARPSGERRVTNSIGLPDMDPLRYSPDGKWLGVQTNRISALILDSSRFQASGPYPGEITSFSPDFGQFATLFNGISPELRIWTVGVSSNRAIIHLDALTVAGDYAHNPSTFCPQLSQDGTVVALRYDLNQNRQTVSRMELFEAATGERILSLESSFGQRADGHFLPDGQTWGYTDGSKIRFWGLRSRTNTHPLECGARVVSFSVSPDGMLLAAGQSDDLISTWDLKRGKRAGTFAGHQDNVTTLAFSPDGRTLASGSKDGTIKLWGLATARELA